MQICFLATFQQIVTQLLFDFIKQAVAYLAPLLAPFQLMLTILCFQDTNICRFFAYRKHMEKYGK